MESDVPDLFVTEAMIDRFLAIDPPVFRVASAFDPIFEEIERTYVRGDFFAALAAAVVTIERLLNTVRIELHGHVSPKIKELWGKGPTNDWQPNISALAKWGYLSPELSAELEAQYVVRCNYLHTGPIETLQADSLEAIHVAYKLLNEFLGFPPRLFSRETGQMKTVDESDPLYQIFYVPHIVTG